MSSSTQDRLGNFRCRRCRRWSGFANLVIDHGGLGALVGDRDSAEARLYKCERCGTENEVALTASQWQIIEQGGVVQLPSSRASGKPSSHDSEERERLEADLASIRAWSWATALVAIAIGGLGVAFDPKKQLTTTGVVMATLVALVAVCNSVPLRQSPHPPQKNPQLHRRLAWRHKVLIGTSVGLIAAIVATVLPRIG